MFRTHSLLSFQTDAVPPKKRKIQVSFIRLSGENETWGSLAQPFSLTCIKKRREREKRAASLVTQEKCVFFFPIFLLCVCVLHLRVFTHTSWPPLASFSFCRQLHTPDLAYTNRPLYYIHPTTNNFKYIILKSSFFFLLGLSPPPPPHRPYVLMDEWSAPLLSCCSVPKKNRFNTRIDSTLLH